MLKSAITVPFLRVEVLEYIDLCFKMDVLGC